MDSFKISTEFLAKLNFDDAGFKSCSNPSLIISTESLGVVVKSPEDGFFAISDMRHNTESLTSITPSSLAALGFDSISRGDFKTKIIKNILFHLCSYLKTRSQKQ